MKAYINIEHIVSVLLCSKEKTESLEEYEIELTPEEYKKVQKAYDNFFEMRRLIRDKVNKKHKTKIM